MGYYAVKRGQDVGGSSSDFYYYTDVVHDGVEDTENSLNGEAQWGTDSSKKKIFANKSDVDVILKDANVTPPNFIGAEVVSE